MLEVTFPNFTDEDAAKRLRDRMAREVARCVDAGDLDGAKAYADIPAWKLFREILND